MAVLAIKVDVDTDRGTRIGVPNMLRLFDTLKIPATFLFSLGPDNTGRAIKRVFRPGFFSKVQRTNVVGVYGIRTLLNGILWPGPDIGRRHAALMRGVRDAGYEVGIHCYDHIRWQDGLAHMNAAQVAAEFDKARTAFARIFGAPATTAGAAGWQANAFSLAAYDAARLDYASDARGSQPFFPRVGTTVFKTLQVPSTLPTLDELIGRPEYPLDRLIDTYLAQMRVERPNVMTVHAELEGMHYLAWFEQFLRRVQAAGIKLVAVRDIAQQALADRANIPVYELVQGSVDGRSGTLALQGATRRSLERT